MADGDVGFDRLEVLSGPTGRRRWPDEVKARIVAESFLPGARVGDVARRHDVVPSQLTTWRRLAREGRLALPWDFLGAPEPGFVPLMVEDATEDTGLPPRASDGGSSKYADALPLYRIAQILARSGVEIDRSTLADWVGRTAFHLEPVVQHMLGHLRRSTKLFMDETSAPVLDPGRGRTKTGFLWALTRDDRRWSGARPAITVFSYAPGRGGSHAEAMLTGFEGVLQVDGYTGYNRLTLSTRTGGAPVTLAHCWAHARREFIEATPKAGSPLADEALRRIAQLYALEAEIRGRPGRGAPRRPPGPLRAARSQPARLGAGQGHATVGKVRPRPCRALSAQALGWPDRVPAGRPRRDGLEPGGKFHQAPCPAKKKQPVRRP